MSDESIIERKLLLDGAGSGEDQQLNVFLKQLVSWAKSDKSPTECESEYNSLLAQLNRLKLNKKKSDIRMRCNRQQLEKYRAMHDEYQAKKKVIVKDIEKQQKFLDEAKIMKKNCIDRNFMVKSINEGPSCKQLVKKVHNLKLENLNLQEVNGNLQSQINNQVRHGRLISLSADMLSLSIQNNSSFDDQIEILCKQV